MSAVAVSLAPGLTLQVEGRAAVRGTPETALDALLAAARALPAAEQVALSAALAASLGGGRGTPIPEGLAPLLPEIVRLRCAASDLLKRACEVGEAGP